MTSALKTTDERMAVLPGDVPRDAVIVTRNLQRDYDMGGEIVRALRGSRSHDPSQRIRRDHGPIRLRASPP